MYRIILHHNTSQYITMNNLKNLFGFDKLLKSNAQTYFPFWKQDINEILKNKQTTLPWCDYFKRFIICEKGLQCTLTQEIKPFNILCDHYQTYLTKNNTRVCATCGLIILATSTDMDYINKKCSHPYAFCSYKNNITYCTQCKSNINAKQPS